MKSFIRYSVILLAMVFASVALSEHFWALPSLMGEVHFGQIGLMVVGLVCYQVWNAGVWSEVLACLYAPRKRMDCARIWLESESLKWLPGALWSYGSRVFLSGEMGLSKKKASSSMVFELLITNIAWGGLAATVIFTFPVSDWLTKLSEMTSVLLVVCLTALCVGGVLALLVVKLEKLRAFLSFGPVDWVKSVRTTAHYMVLCIFNAGLLWGVIQAVPGLDVPFIAAVGVAGTAWIAGFWAVGVPGGIGVREAVIVTLVCHFGSIEQAILVAALWRGCQMIAEVVSVSLVVGTGMIVKAKKSRLKKKKKYSENSTLIY